MAPGRMVVAEGKSQEVRLLDVFLLGPFMVWFGARAQDVPPWARQAMILSGVATIAYNGTNYLKIEAERRG